MYSVIDSPMWNFTSQSPEAPSLVVPLSDQGAAPAATSDPPQVTSTSDGVPLPASDHGDSGKGSIPEAVPTVVSAAPTVSSNVPAVGDFYHIFENADVLPLSWALPGNFLILAVCLFFVVLWHI